MVDKFETLVYNKISEIESGGMIFIGPFEIEKIILDTNPTHNLTGIIK